MNEPDLYSIYNSYATAIYSDLEEYYGLESEGYNGVLFGVSLESSIWESIRGTALQILEKIIKLFGAAIDRIRRLYITLMTNATKFSTYLRKHTPTRGKDILLKVKNIDISISALRKELKSETLSDTEKDNINTNISKLEDEKNDLIDKYDLISKNYTVASDHYNAVMSVFKFCDAGIRIAASTHKSFEFEISKYDYIPNMFNAALYDTDTNKVGSNSGALKDASITMGSGAVTGLKAAAGLYNKMYNEEDPEYNDYIKIIEKYDNGDWSRNIDNIINKINAKMNEITQMEETDTTLRSIKAIKVKDFEKMAEEYTETPKILLDINRTIGKYKAILDSKYSKNKMALNKGLLFFKPKAPQYLLTILSIFTKLSTSCTRFLEFKSNALYTMVS